MHLRKLTLTVGLFGALFSSWAFGLGLGEITLRSTLNQPLDAEIKLLQVRNLNKEEILVELASAADFQRFGIERLFFLQNLKFDVQLDHPAGPLVRVRSDEPVREPYLVFLVQAQSPSSGRLLREYTLLMDLPVFAEQPTAPVRAPALQPEAPRVAEPAVRPQPASPATPRVAQREGEPYRAPPAPGRSTSATPAGTIDGDAYVVQSNDTLWEIASRVRPSGVSIQQSMLALQSANPDAFINGNINLLKRGQVLRIPEGDEWRALDQQSAVREVALQNSDWSRGRSDAGRGAELAATSSRPTQQRSGEAPRGQLTLSAPGSADQAGETSGAGSTGARTEALQNELAIASEELDAARRENRELNSRILELEEQIATMERLLDVSSAELRALQLAAEQSLPTSDETAAEGDGVPVADAETAVTAPVETESAIAADVAETASPQPVAAPVKTVVPRQPQPTLMDKVMGQIWYIAAGLLAVIAGLGYFLYRRRQEAEWQSFDNEDAFGTEPGDDLNPEEFVEDGFGDEADFGQDSDFDDQSDAESEFDFDEPVQAETGDVVAEADIYIAYGKLEQAEEMLRRALADDPAHQDARLKLLEVYVEANDIEAFDNEYQVLLSSGDAGASSRAAELRAGIADAPPFAGDLSPVEQTDFEKPDFEQEQEADDSPLVELADNAELGENTLDLDGVELDFEGLDLDFDLDGDADGEAKPIDFNLEFDKSSQNEVSFELDSADISVDEQSSEKEGEDVLGDLELSLDDDLLGLDAEEESPGTSAPAVADDFTFDLDLDLDSAPEEPTQEAAELDLALTDEMGESESEEYELSEGDAPLTLEVADLDLESIVADSAEELEDEAVVGSGEPADIEDDIFALDSDADDFDMELGDLDLEALDQEMDALVGSVDDEDVALADPLTIGDDVSLQAQEQSPEISSAAFEADLEFDGLDIDLKLDELTEDQAQELARDNPFGADQDFDPDDLEDEFDFLAESDEVATKLDLARAYIDMGDQEGAKDILDEVNAEGNEEQKREAQELLEKMV